MGAARGEAGQASWAEEQQQTSQGRGQGQGQGRGQGRGQGQGESGAMYGHSAATHAAMHAAPPPHTATHAATHVMAEEAARGGVIGAAMHGRVQRGGSDSSGKQAPSLPPASVDPPAVSVSSQWASFISAP